MDLKKLPAELAVQEFSHGEPSDMESEDESFAVVFGNPATLLVQSHQLQTPNGWIVLDDTVLEDFQRFPLLERSAKGLQGTTTGDNPRFIQGHWEQVRQTGGWERLQSTSDGIGPFGGLTPFINFKLGSGPLASSSQARVQGLEARGLGGCAVAQMRALPAALFLGAMFDMNTAVVLPRNPADLPAIWCYLSSPEYVRAVRAIDQKLNVTNATLVKVPLFVTGFAPLAGYTVITTPNGSGFTVSCSQGGATAADNAGVIRLSL